MADPVAFFLEPKHAVHRRYEALRAYFVDRLSVTEVSERYEYTTNAFRVLCTRFRQGTLAPFFRDDPTSRKETHPSEVLKQDVLRLRKQGLSIYDISRQLELEGTPASHQTIWTILDDAGIPRLPKRSAAGKRETTNLPLPVADIRELDLSSGQTLSCRAPLLFLFAPMLVQLGFDKLVRDARYPGSYMIPSPAYLRSILTLKLLSYPRKIDVMPIADDQGLGLFAGLNVLPKTTALSDYSYRVGPSPHRTLLSGLVRAKDRLGSYPELSFNLDFHAIRHYGEKGLLENNYVPRRSQSVSSILTSFAQEIGSREIVYANANLLKSEKSDEVLRFVDYWERTTGKTPNELVFDSRMTDRSGLAKLDKNGVCFLTLRERRKNELARISSLPKDDWQRVELDIKDRKWRRPLIFDEKIEIPGYPKKIRQISALDLGREEPTILLTNDTHRGASTLLTRYARRTLIENSIGEQVHFFHVDSLSSDVRIKVDLDIVLTVLASGLYRWLAGALKGFETATARLLWRTFLDRPGQIRLSDDAALLCVRRFSQAPTLLESKVGRDPRPIPWFGNRVVRLKIL